MAMPPELQAWVDDYEWHDPYSWIVEVDPDEVEKLAVQRAAEAVDAPRFVDDLLKINRVGAMGEFAMHRRYGLPAPVSHPGGDGGADFRVKFPNRMLSLDVKTREEMPTRYLMVPCDACGPRSADVFIQCQRIDARRVRLMGWEHRSVLMMEPPSDWGYQRPTYARPIRQLRPMYQLDYLMNLRQA